MSTPRIWLEYTPLSSAPEPSSSSSASLWSTWRMCYVSMPPVLFCLVIEMELQDSFCCIVLHYTSALQRESKPESLQQVLLVVNRKETSFWPLLLLLLLPILLVSSASPRPMHATEHTPIQVKPRHQPSKQPTINLPSGIHSRHQTP